MTIPPFVVFEREKLDGEVVQDKCHPYSYKCVINVGGINNNNLESSVKSDIIESSFSSIYTKSDSCNYGSGVSFYAPFMLLL